MGKTKSFSCRVSQELYDKFSKSLIGGTTISEMLRSYITNFVNGEDVFSVPDENLKNYNIGFEEGCVKNKIVSTKISDELRNKLLKRIGETVDDIPIKTDDVIRLIMICHITRFGITMGTIMFKNEHYAEKKEVVEDFLSCIEMFKNKHCAKVVENENSSVVENDCGCDCGCECECVAESSDYCGEKSWFGRLIERMVRFLRERFFSI